MGKYTAADYKRIIKEYCEINPHAKAALDKEVVYNADLFELDSDELIDFIAGVLGKKSRSLKFMLNQKGRISMFFDWCVEKRYISTNVLKEEEFDNEYFIEKNVEVMDIKAFYDEDVEVLIQKQERNKILYEVLIRGFYEGIRNIKEFVLLKYEDVDFDERIITAGGKTRRMTEAFFIALEQYRDIYIYEGYGPGANNPKINIMSLTSYKDYIFKISDTDNLTDSLYQKNMTANISNYFKRISLCAGYTVSYDMLYISGFINYVKEKCDENKKPLDYFIKLFYVRNNERGFTKIVEYANNYGFTKEAKNATEVRRLCLPYVMKGKYYQ